MRMLPEVLSEGLEVTELYWAPPFTNSTPLGMGNAFRYGSRLDRAEAREAMSGTSAMSDSGDVSVSFAKAMKKKVLFLTRGPPKPPPGRSWRWLPFPSPPALANQSLASNLSLRM